MGRSKSLTVALLISDISVVRELSKIFKETGVIPHFYETLRDFWDGIIQETPSLSVVDVKMMSDGKLFLQNHPDVKSESLPLLFYYSSESSPKMSVAFECFNLGFINRELGLRGQLKSILKRINTFYRLDSENNFLKGQAEKVDTKVEKVVRVNQELQEKSYYQNLFYSMTNDFEHLRNEDSFIAAVDKVFSKYKEINTYTAFELSQSGKKLIGLESKSEKFFDIPGLWLGKLCEEGIESFAQNLASQVVFDLMGENIVSLNIKGLKKHPEALLFIQCRDRETLENFNWELLERFLSGVCEHYKLMGSPANVDSGLFINPWELFSVLDSKFFGKQPGDKVLQRGLGSKEISLLNLDFSNLVDYIRAKKTSRFYWREFFSDFCSKLDGLAIESLKVIPMGVENIGLVVPQNSAEDSFRLVKGLISRYSFWRFFEDTDLVMVKSLKPELRMSPLSTEGYFQVLGGLQFQAEALLDREEKEERTKQIIWGDNPPDKTV